MNVTTLIATALELAATMEPARAAESGINEAINHGLRITYTTARECLGHLGTDHPDRASLQVAASSALTPDDLRTVITDALSAIVQTRQLIAV